MVEGLNRIGRAPGNEIRVEDPTVSTEHCELWVMKERLLLRDLDSTNGTFVQGRAVTEVELRPGDVISVGAVELTLTDVANWVAIPRAPEMPPPRPRSTAQGEPCCINHSEVPAEYRCPKCGEQYCGECVRVLGRRGAARHAYCPQCSVDCVAIQPSQPRAGRGTGRRGWLAKLTQTLRIRG